MRTGSAAWSAVYPIAGPQSAFYPRPKRKKRDEKKGIEYCTTYKTSHEMDHSYNHRQHGKTGQKSLLLTTLQLTTSVLPKVPLTATFKTLSK